MRRVVLALVLTAAFVASGCISGPVESPPTPASPEPRSASPSVAAAVLMSGDASRPSIAVDAESPSPSSTDEPVPSAAGPEVVVSIPSQFGDLRVRVDSNGLIVSGRAATQAELARIDLGARDIAVLSLARSDLLVVWTGTICERSARLVVVPDLVFLAPDPRQGCDAMGFGWGLVLTTREPIDASHVDARMAPTILLP
jgi:hypothetical protein